MGSSFERAIAEHLELKQRNTTLEQRLPLVRYLAEDGRDLEHGVYHLVGPRNDAATPSEPDSRWDAADTSWESLPAFSWGD